MPDKTIHLNITISGFVQGVGFRYSALLTARRTEVKGFVRNLLNGDVYIEAEGERLKLDEFVSWCYKGPSHALVERVRVYESKPKNFKTFEISL